MQQALDQVRADLGRDAVILNTRTIDTGGLFRFWRRSQVEIYASPDVRLRPPAPGRTPAPAAARPTAPEPDRQALFQALSTLQKQVAALAEDSGDTGSFPTHLRAHYRQIVDRGVNAALARRYLRQIHDQFSAAEVADALKVRVQLTEYMRDEISVTGAFTLRSGGPTVIALLGPTGVGKTTTIAKLAAQYAITDRCRVGLVTADTYRIAAVEQLRVYAEILQLPLEVVMTPSELQAALARFQDKDVVLIDTAGRSPNDATKLHELEGILHTAQPHYAALCLSATTHSDDVLSIVERFSLVPLSSIVLTKLDETTRPGWILNTCEAVDAPIAYVTTGQNVPDDIEVADAGRLVARVLGEEGAARRIKPPTSARWLPREPGARVSSP